MNMHYPQELEETIALPDGRNFLLRPVRPEDEPAFHAAFVNYHPNGATHYRLNGATQGCSRRLLKRRYDFTTFPLGVSFARVSATGLASSGRGFGAR